MLKCHNRDDQVWCSMGDCKEKKHWHRGNVGSESESSSSWDEERMREKLWRITKSTYYIRRVGGWSTKTQPSRQSLLQISDHQAIRIWPYFPNAPQFPARVHYCLLLVKFKCTCPCLINVLVKINCVVLSCRGRVGFFVTLSLNVIYRVFAIVTWNANDCQVPDTPHTCR